MKAFIIVNFMNVVLSLILTFYFCYTKTDSILIWVFFFLGITYFNKLLIEQAFKGYGKSIK